MADETEIDRRLALIGVAILAGVLIFLPGVVPAISGWIADLVTPTIQDSVTNLQSTTTTNP